uniref:Uncharacterized protein n=1 Tax=Sus scrofa TaxID=9823 RepID=A0A8D1STR8_PIG
MPSGGIFFFPPLSFLPFAFSNATHSRRRLGSTSSNSPCGSAQDPAEAAPTTLVSPAPTRDTGGLASFLGMSTLSFLATVLETPKHWESAEASSGMIPCDLAPEARKPCGSSSPVASLAQPTAGHVLSGHQLPGFLPRC